MSAVEEDWEAAHTQPYTHTYKLSRGHFLQRHHSLRLSLLAGQHSDERGGGLEGGQARVCERGALIHGCHGFDLQACGAWVQA